MPRRKQTLPKKHDNEREKENDDATCSAEPNSKDDDQASISTDSNSRLHIDEDQLLSDAEGSDSDPKPLNFTITSNHHTESTSMTSSKFSPAAKSNEFALDLTCKKRKTCDQPQSSSIPPPKLAKQSFATSPQIQIRSPINNDNNSLFTLANFATSFKNHHQSQKSPIPAPSIERKRHCDVIMPSKIGETSNFGTKSNFDALSKLSSLVSKVGRTQMIADFDNHAVVTSSTCNVRQHTKSIHQQSIDNFPKNYKNELVMTSSLAEAVANEFGCGTKMNGAEMDARGINFQDLWWKFMKKEENAEIKRLNEAKQIFTCLQCQASFQTMDQLVKHMEATQHFTNIPKHYSWSLQYARQKMRQMKMKMKYSDKMMYFCYLCQAPFTEPVQVHFNLMHSMHNPAENMKYVHVMSSSSLGGAASQRNRPSSLDTKSNAADQSPSSVGGVSKASTNRRSLGGKMTKNGLHSSDNAASKGLHSKMDSLHSKMDTLQKVNGCTTEGKHNGAVLTMEDNFHEDALSKLEKIVAK